MRRQFFILVSLLMLTLNSNANELFSYDRASVEQSMSNLTALEVIVETENVSLEQLRTAEPELSRNLVYGERYFSSVFESPLGLPSFLWGCLLGVFGILLVYIITQDSEETKKALWGCVVGSLAGCVIYIAYYIFILGIYSTY